MDFGLQDWLVGLISDRWLGLLLVWASDYKVFFGFQCFGWSKPLDLRRWLTKNAEHKDVGWGWVSGYCCCVYFKFLGFFFFFFSCGFDYFSRFMGLICWRFQWRIGILNEFLHVYLLRKCNKRKENIDCFNFLGNHTCSSYVLSRRTCYFVLSKIMKRKKN